jgi:transposase-like protein
MHLTRDETIAEALGWLANDVPIAEVADNFGVSPRTLRNWLLLYSSDQRTRISLIRKLHEKHKQFEKDLASTRKELEVLQASIKKNSSLQKLVPWLLASSKSTV